MKKPNPFKMTRRQVLKAGLYGGASLMLPWRFLPAKAFADPAATGLLDPSLQPKFVNAAPNALAPSFLFFPTGFKRGRPAFRISMKQFIHNAGLKVPNTDAPLLTPAWGYAPPYREPTYPGRTFIVWRDRPIAVKWKNKLIDGTSKLPLPHLLPVDTNLHWAYSLQNYTQYSIEENGVPVVTHLHGGHSRSPFDGNPEFFFSPNFKVRGPQWKSKWYIYDNDQDAGNLWYHDHALGLTRLNVYAGLAGFYFIRDRKDTGFFFNPLGLPAYPYELAYAIQDKMFTQDGQLFYPAFPGDPFYKDFIVDEEADLVTSGKFPVCVTDPDFPDYPLGTFCGPSALAEFFGDHMLVNGVIWPKADVEPRNYRMHLLNGTDSRFMLIRFREVPIDSTDPADSKEPPLEFYVIGSDQGLAGSATKTDILLSEPGSRYDVVFDFSQVPFGKRVIMENIGGDEPFGGDPGPQLFSDTNKIMAFDVVSRLRKWIPDRFNPKKIRGFSGNPYPHTRVRKVALFEGKDEFGRLQPLLGTAEPATDYLGEYINWPNTPEYKYAVLPDGTPSPLTGPMEGSIAWHSPTTENPALNSTEEWEIWNMTGDAHPIHLHLVNFEVLGRQLINFDSNADADGFIPDGMSPANDGVYLVQQATVQHNSEAGKPETYGIGFRIVHPDPNVFPFPDPDDVYGAPVNLGGADGYVENAPKDMVTALPGQVTRIKATFDRPKRYVWHCHILSHEDHEMMRVLHVGPGAFDDNH